MVRKLFQSDESAPSSEKESCLKQGLETRGVQLQLDREQYERARRGVVGDSGHQLDDGSVILLLLGHEKPRA